MTTAKSIKFSLMTVKALRLWANENNVVVLDNPVCHSEKQYVSIFSPKLHHVNHCQVFISYQGQKEELKLRLS
jgi:hypothetical protein